VWVVKQAAACTGRRRQPLSIGGKRFSLIVRYLGMRQVRASGTGMWVGVTTTAALVSWHAAAATLIAMVVSGVLRLLTEWQRRRTIRALMAGAPVGTVLIVSDSPTRQFMKASLGSGPSLQPNSGS
jgi:hypothetical protein